MRVEIDEPVGGLGRAEQHLGTGGAFDQHAIVVESELAGARIAMRAVWLHQHEEAAAVDRGVQ